MRTTVFLAVITLSSCTDGSASSDGRAATADAARLDDGGLACGPGTPGVRAHITVFYVDGGSTPLWSTGSNDLGLTTTGGTEPTHASLESSSLDASYRATVPLPYPSGTTAGPATLNFYAIGPGVSGNWVGRTDLTAAPATCTDVALDVRFVAFTDAGP